MKIESTYKITHIYDEVNRDILGEYDIIIDKIIIVDSKRFRLARDIRNEKILKILK